MAETDKLLKTVLVMQAEILGRLEALEQAAGSPRNGAHDRMQESLGLGNAPTYEDPRMEALHQLREAIEAGNNRNLDNALRDVTALVNHHD